MSVLNAKQLEGKHDTSLYWLAPVSVFFIALVVRLLITFELKEVSPFFDYPIIDAMVYDGLARFFADNGQFGNTGAFYQPPLYPLFLAGIYKVFGDSYLWPRIIQSFVGAGSCLVLSDIGRRFAGRFAGWLGGIICAFYGPLIYFELDLLAPVLTVFLSLLGLSVLYRGLAKQQLLLLFISGILTGLATITWPLAGLFGCAGVTTVFLKFKNNIRRSLLYSTAIIIGVILPIVPVSSANFVKGQPVLISSNGPITFYAANNIDWKNTVLFRPGYSWEKIATLPNRLYSAEEVKKRGMSRIYLTETVNYIKSSPRVYVKAVLSKISHLVYGFEIMNPTDMYFFKQFSSILDKLISQNNFLKFPFGILLPFSVVGMFFAFKSKKENNFLFISYLLWGSFGLVLFCVSARFRLILVPILILYAAFGIQEFIKLRNKGIKADLLLIVFILGIGSYSLSNFDLFQQQALFERPVVKSQAFFAMGRVMIRQGRDREALQWLKKAVETDSNYPDAWVDLGRAKYSLGDRNGAIEAMLKAHEVASDYPLPLFNLAKIYDKSGKEQTMSIYYYQEFLIRAESYYETLLRGRERVDFARKRLRALTGSN